MRRSTFLLLGAVLGACSNDTFTGDDGGSDTGSDVAVGGGEGGSTDGAIGKDGSTTPKRFCQEVDAQFCADFDIPNDAGAGFVPPTLLGTWTLSFQGAQKKSSPIALEVDTKGDAQPPSAAFIENADLSNGNIDGGPATRLVVEADLYLPTPGFTPDPIFVFRAGVLPLRSIQFGLAAHVGVWKLVRSTNGTPVPLSPQPPSNQWVHAVLSIDINSSNGNVTLDIDNTAHAQMSGPTGVDGGTTYPGYVAAGADDLYVSQSSITYYVDNVVARWQ